jgi:hypothetical protein
MRYGAPRIVRPRRHNTMVDDRTVESELGQIIRPEELVIDRVTRGNTAGSPAQKLPRTAILKPQNRYYRFNRPFPCPSGFSRDDRLEWHTDHRPR